MLSRRRASVLTVVLLLCLDSTVRSQEPLRKVILPGEARQLTSRLKLADELAGKQKWAEAIDEYQRLLGDAADALLPADRAKAQGPVPRLSIQVRRLCHARLAALPGPALEIYRRRVDLQARRWLRQGTAERDVGLLRRIVDEAFCSRPCEQALDLLGDLAFEQGDFARAGRWWRLLAVPASEAKLKERPDLGQWFPDPQGDLARVRAKQILASIFQGDLSAAASELEAFEKVHPRAEGHLAGRRGNYAIILHEWLRKPPPFPENDTWPTFAGSASRCRVLPQVPPRRLWVDGPTWRVRLDDGSLLPAEATEPEGPAPSAALARRLAYHPVIVDKHVLVADARRVLAFDLFTGQLRFRYDLPDNGGPAGKPAAEPGLRCTLTAEDGRVYARMGITALTPPKKDPKEESSFLVCLELKAKEKQRERWRIAAKGKAGEAALFEGAPLVEANRVYIAVSRPADGRTRTALACYDADCGALRWQQDLCDVPEPPRLYQHLLTLAGGQLVYCSHGGAVVAVDAATGKLVWGMRYPSRGPKTRDASPSPRDLAPAIYADNRLFLAPLDTDRIFCLDPETGWTLWERDGIESVHLLGCSHGRLIFTTPTGLRAVGPRTGSDADGWLQPVEGKLAAFGRGLIARDWVFWPVQDGRLPMRALNVRTGSQQRGEEIFEATQLRQIRGGNLAYGYGCLVVAGVEELAGYVPPEHFLEKRRQDAAAHGAWLRLVEHHKDAATAARLRSPEDVRPAKASQHAQEWPALALPLVRTWQTRSGPLLVPCSSPLTPHKVDVVFSHRSSVLACWDAASGKRRWSVPLPCAPSWLGCQADRVLTAGPVGIRAVALANGRPLWDCLPEAALPAEAGLLGAFHLTRKHLLLLQGPRRLVALDLATGRLAWDRWAPSALLYPQEGGQFHAKLHAGDARVLLQTTGGQRLLLDSHNGCLTHQAATAREPWPQAPLPLGEDHLGIVESARRVFVLEAASAKEVWTWKPRLPTTLSGEPARLFSGLGGLFLVVPRNYGYDLERLDPKTGGHLWPEKLRLTDAAIDHEALVSDKKAVYFAAGNTLLARSVADGKLLWKRPLGIAAKRWQVLHAGSCLIVWPREMEWGLKWHWLPLGEAPVAIPLRLPIGRILPVLLHNLVDGRLLQRLDFETDLPEGAVQLFPGRLVVSAGGMTWGLAPAPAK
jgi:outer membrane protein assembly factor BamB